MQEQETIEKECLSRLTDTDLYCLGRPKSSERVNKWRFLSVCLFVSFVCWRWLEKFLTRTGLQISFLLYEDRSECTWLSYFRFIIIIIERENSLISPIFYVRRQFSASHKNNSNSNLSQYNKFCSRSIKFTRNSYSVSKRLYNKNFFFKY